MAQTKSLEYAQEKLMREVNRQFKLIQLFKKD